MNRSTFLLILFSLSSELCLLPQAPPTVEETLRLKGVGTSVASLRTALQDSRAEVRGLVAALLAEKRDIGSIPAITLRIDKATTTLERLNLSQALLTLGSVEGIAATKSICTDSSVREDLRLIAASRLIEVGNDDCNASVVEMLSNTSSPSTRQSAMELLKNIVLVPSTLRVGLRTGLERALGDEIPSNRQSASERIALFKFVESRGPLERAAAIETDTTVHLQMQADLTKLSK